VSEASPAAAARHSYRVLVVDDSAVIRGLLIRALETDPEITVVGSVGDGRMALNALGRNDPEVVILDIEMPVMDGLTALPQIIAAKPDVKVVMASTLTRRNADISLRALDAGAADYVTKPGSTALVTAEDFKRELVAKVKALAQARRAARGEKRPSPGVAAPRREPVVPPPAAKPVLRPAPTEPPEVLAIASSTGGPQALFQLLGRLRGGIDAPILITQHMPATFTTILAEHIGRQSGWPAAEAVDGEPVRGGRVYIAPGDFHMTVEAAASGQKLLRLDKNPPENFCRPAADPMLRSLARVYGRRVLCLVLTGMGHDGLRGGREVVAAGGAVLAQDEATSVVWGMPGAVAAAGLCSAVLPLDELAAYVRRLAMRTAA
jgi:two-component system, chemotaxis family, protein-glutamate methylesterase/glutaminase